MKVQPTVRLICALLLLSAAVFTSGCATTTDAVTGERVRNMYSLEEDIRMGEGVFRDIMTQMQKVGAPINANKKNVDTIQQMINRITAVSHIPDLPYQFALFETNIVNAAAAPGGKIVVFSGLYHPQMGLARTEDEVAAVIAHEVAHVTCRHTTEALTRRLPTDLLLLAGSIYAQVEEENELALIMSAAFIAYEGFFLPKYSRDDEAEADAVGLMYMAKAGYDPRAAARLWKRASEREGRSSALSRWTSSHPSSDDRHQNLERLMPQALAEYEKARAETER